MPEPAQLPEGWDEERVRRVLEHYETQPDEGAVAEDEAEALLTPVTVPPAART